MLRAGIFLEDQKIITPNNFIQNPTISVILPTFCRGSNGLLKRAILSVLTQTYTNFELIIVDDGSVDETAYVITEFQKMDNRILYVRHDKNSGLPAIRVNEGVILARGAYIAYQFDDDQWKPNALEVLYNTSIQLEKPSLVYGKSLLIDSEKEYEIGEDFNYSSLINGNIIANNSVLHPKKFVLESGGYDPHLVMRRVCDWDLWLRWSKKYPFKKVDEVVSIVDIGKDNSLGRTVSFDINLFRLFININRDSLLKPENLQDYVIDDLEFLGDILSKENKKNVYNKHIIPWYLKNRITMLENGQSLDYSIHNQPDTMLITKYHYDTTIDITLNNFTDLLKKEIFSYFVPQLQVTEETLTQSGMVLFHRTCDDHSTMLLNKVKEKNLPIIYALDDDLFSLYELGEEFEYLKPNTIMHNALVTQVSQADMVLSYSKIITSNVKRNNPRVYELKTNILQKYILREFSSSEDNIFRIAFAGGSARKLEFEFLWPVLQQLAEEFKEKIEFYFWGVNPKEYALLSSPTYFQPFTTSYDEYMNRLSNVTFDVMLSPLFDEHQAKRAKSPIKYLEITSAGCIGIYSDVFPYAIVKENGTGIIAQNQQAEWYAAIKKAYGMSQLERKQIWDRAKSHISDEFTTEAQANELMSAIRAAKLHAKTKNKRNEDGQPLIAFFFHSAYLGGAENHLFRHAMLAARYGFKPIICLPDFFRNTREQIIFMAEQRGYRIEYLSISYYTEPFQFQKNNTEYVEIYEWLTKNNISLVHSVTLMPNLSLATNMANIPHISSLYAVEFEKQCRLEFWNKYSQLIHSDSVYYATQWNQLFNIESRCIRSWVPEPFFKIGKERLLREKPSQTLRVGISGTLQERKGQLEAIQAVGILKKQLGLNIELHLYGYLKFFPEYLNKCISIVEEYELTDNVFFHDFKNNPIEYMADLDVILCASSFESFPQAILEGMAMGIFIVSSPAGGISELIIDGQTGIFLESNSPEAIAEGLNNVYQMSDEKFRKIIENAYRIAKEESSSASVANQLLSMYNDAFELLDKNTSNLKVVQSKSVPDSLIIEKSLKTIDIISQQGNNELMPSKIIRKVKEYRIIIENENWCGLTTMFGTHQKLHLGNLTVNILTESNRVPIRSVIIPMHTISDNTEHDIDFVEIGNCKNKEFIIQYKFDYKSNHNGISVYEWRNKQETKISMFKSSNLFGKLKYRTT